MIEAVNSAVANTSLVRGNAEQLSSARLEIPTDKPQAPRAPYISPYIAIDNNFDTAVLQIRDSETGDVLRQFPTEQTLSTRQRQAQLAESRESNAPSPQAAPQASTNNFDIQVLNDVQSAPQASENSFANAQLASVALNAGAQSGQSVAASVNVTA